jgi:alkaline phosphatase D
MNNNEEVVTLEQYRNRYALYKMDPDLMQVRATHPFFYVWDDHEVDNNWSRLVPEDNQTTEEFRARRLTGTQAMYEHQPLAEQPRGYNIQLYKKIEIGDDLASIFLLDTRQFRNEIPCMETVPRANPPVPKDCPERFDPNLSILGSEQEDWLLYGLENSNKAWNIVASPSWFSQFSYYDVNGTRSINTDSFDGYPVQVSADNLQEQGRGGMGLHSIPTLSLLLTSILCCAEATNH